MVKAYRSVDHRIKTEQYVMEGIPRFSLAEPTKIGTLLTEFNADGEVLRQEYHRGRDIVKELSNFIENKVEIEETGKEYEKIKVNAVCEACGGEIERELDRQRPEEIENVGVVPIYVCKKCGRRYYSMNDLLLKRLINERKDLFEPNELEELEQDERAFLATLQANIIRIFASKRIFRLKTK